MYLDSGCFPFFFHPQGRWGWHTVSVLRIPCAVFCAAGLTCVLLSPPISPFFSSCWSGLHVGFCWHQSVVPYQGAVMKKPPLSWELGLIFHPTTRLGFQVQEKEEREAPPHRKSQLSLFLFSPTTVLPPVFPSTHPGKDFLTSS